MVCLSGCLTKQWCVCMCAVLYLQWMTRDMGVMISRTLALTSTHKRHTRLGQTLREGRHTTHTTYISSVHCLLECGELVVVFVDLLEDVPRREQAHHHLVALAPITTYTHDQSIHQSIEPSINLPSEPPIHQSIHQSTHPSPSPLCPPHLFLLVHDTRGGVVVAQHSDGLLHRGRVGQLADLTLTLTQHLCTHTHTTRKARQTRDNRSVPTPTGTATKGDQFFSSISLVCA